MWSVQRLFGRIHDQSFWMFVVSSVVRLHGWISKFFNKGFKNNIISNWEREKRNQDLSPNLWHSPANEPVDLILPKCVCFFIFSAFFCMPRFLNLNPGASQPLLRRLRRMWPYATPTARHVRCLMCSTNSHSRQWHAPDVLVAVGSNDGSCLAILDALCGSTKIPVVKLASRTSSRFDLWFSSVFEFGGSTLRLYAKWVWPWLWWLVVFRGYAHDNNRFLSKWNAFAFQLPVGRNNPAKETGSSLCLSSCGFAIDAASIGALIGKDLHLFNWLGRLPRKLF